MPELRFLSRRTVLTMLLAVLAFRRGVAPATAKGKIAVSLRSLLAPVSGSAAHLGRAYLATAPLEADRTSLQRALQRDIPVLREAAAGGRVDETWALLQARIADDYSEGRIAELDGWIVSRTEARLCALHAVGDMREPAVTS